MRNPIDDQYHVGNPAYIEHAKDDDEHPRCLAVPFRIRLVEIQFGLLRLYIAGVSVSYAEDGPVAVDDRHVGRQEDDRHEDDNERCVFSEIGRTEERMWIVLGAEYILPEHPEVEEDRHGPGENRHEGDGFIRHQRAMA